MATITSKGQVTIPLAVRQALHLSAGDRVEFVQTSEGHFEVIAASKDISQLKGIVKTTKIVTLEEMDDAIAKGASQI